MAARGTVAKTNFFAELQKIYPDSFFDDKVLRIPYDDDGTPVELKIAVTCAKDILGSGKSASAVPTLDAPASTESASNELTDVEKADLKSLFSNWSF